MDVLAHGSHEGISSSASSVLNLEVPTPDMIVIAPEAEVGTLSSEQSSISGHTATHPGDEESKKHLRDQLRRTLSRKESFGGKQWLLYPSMFTQATTCRPRKT